jgi:acylphosphatase
MLRRTTYFSGRVQGVGFRYTAQNIAGRHNVQGYVRNTADGRVELVMEGAPEELDLVLNAIKERMDGYIKNIATHDSPARNEFREFSIRD